jgi:hypothetical protein
LIKNRQTIAKYLSQNKVYKAQLVYAKNGQHLSSENAKIMNFVTYSISPVGRVIITNTKDNCLRVCEEKVTFEHCWWECKLVQPLFEAVCEFLKSINKTIMIYHHITTVNISKHHASLCLTFAFPCLLFTKPKISNHPKIPSKDE